jgi:hypothetical protein
MTVNVANEIVSRFDQSPPSPKSCARFSLRRQPPPDAIFGLYFSLTAVMIA